MACPKRNIIEISSGSDDDNPLVSRFKIRRRGQRAENEPAGTFHQFLEGALPRNLIAADVAEYIQRESNIRLQIAKEEGVLLEDMFIGRDCLPGWIHMQWKFYEETWHVGIQNMLLDLEVSSILGDMIRARLTDLGNRKLEEARQLGLSLEDITIGKGLLAEWDPSAVRAAIPVEWHSMSEEQGDRLMFGEEPANSGIRTAMVDIASPVSSTSSGYESPSESDSSRDSLHTSDTDSYFTDRSSDYEDEDRDAFDDVISMANAVDGQPQYTESDDEAPHILHDVEIAGGPDGYSEVDMEVYLVEDDDEEAEELPGTELAVDAAAYAYFFGDEGAVDVEIPNTQLQCTLDIPSDDSYNEEADTSYDEANFFKEDLLEDDDEDFGCPNEDEDDQSDIANEDNEQDEDGINARTDDPQESFVVPMSLSEDEEQNSGIEITEEGFSW
ncbi:hypothetical protein ACHAQJ_003143 [Trichoderma viride]